MISEFNKNVGKYSVENEFFDGFEKESAITDNI